MHASGGEKPRKPRIVRPWRRAANLLLTPVERIVLTNRAKPA
jgi:hypothetical protein